MFEILTRYASQFQAGASMTLQITVISVLIACSLSLPLAILRRSEQVWLRWPIRLYVSFFRGTPLLAQLFLVYYGSGQFRAGGEERGPFGVFFRPPLLPLF